MVQLFILWACLPVGDETQETVSNMYLFANYVWDSEILQYHCYRRQYDPVLARFTSRDPVAGSYEEPMTLHKYLYCGNDAINRTDPSGENYAGALVFAGRVVKGLNAYYAGLDEGLKAAGGDWWAVLDVAITANDFRETYFKPENLNRPIDWSPVRDKVYLSIYNLMNACDWGGLARCVGWNYVKGLKYEVPLVLMGEISCAVCATDFEPISKVGFCIGCGIYRYSSVARSAATLVNIEQCAEKHCKLRR